MSQPPILCWYFFFLTSEPKDEHSGPLPQKTSRNLHRIYFYRTEISIGLQFQWKKLQFSFNKQTRAHLVKTCHPLANLQTLPTADKESLLRELTWVIQQPKHSSRIHIEPNRDTTWRARLWTPHDLYFIKSLLSGTGNIIGFSSTYRNIQS